MNPHIPHHKYKVCYTPLHLACIVVSVCIRLFTNRLTRQDKVTEYAADYLVVSLYMCLRGSLSVADRPQRDISDFDFYIAVSEGISLSL